MAKDCLDLVGKVIPGGTVKVKVCGSDFVPLWDGTIMQHSLAERRLLEGTYSLVG